MKKRILTILLILPILIFAQKIKIKKEVITFDGKEIARVNSDIRNNYSFSTLEKEKVFNVVFKGLSADATQGFQWLEITSTSGVKTEIPYEVLMTSFNPTKLIIKLLKEKYQLFTDTELNLVEIDNFFTQEREVLSDKYAKTVLSVKNDKEERYKKVGQYNPFVKDNGTILFGGSNGTKIVGHVIFGNKTYSVYDLDKILIGSATGCSTCTTVKAKTFTDETFEYDFGSRTMLQPTFSRTFAQIFVEELISRDYKLGREAKKYKERLNNEKIKVAKENSINLYGVPGFVIDKEGKKYTGTIYAIFEKLQLDLTQQESDLYDLNSIDKFGKFVSIKYKNEKGRLRTKRFTARNKISFGATVENVETIFYSLKTKGNALKKISNASNLGFDNSYFYQVEYNKDNHMVLSKPGDQDTYVLKFKDSKVGFMIDKRKNNSISNALSKFISKCKSLSKDIENEEFDLSNLENLKTIIDEYIECK